MTLIEITLFGTLKRRCTLDVMEYFWNMFQVESLTPCWGEVLHSCLKMSRTKCPMQHHVAPHRRCRLSVHVSHATLDVTPCHTSPPQGVPCVTVSCNVPQAAMWLAGVELTLRKTQIEVPRWFIYFVPGLCLDEYHLVHSVGRILGSLFPGSLLLPSPRQAKDLRELASCTSALAMLWSCAVGRCT